MDYEELSRDLDKAIRAGNYGWGDLDIWPENGRDDPAPVHVFTSAVLAVIGDCPVERASWRESEGTLVATVWTKDLVIQGTRGAGDTDFPISVLSRKSLSALRVHNPPILSMSSWGIQAGDLVAELVYPEFTAAFSTHRETDFLAALNSFQDDLKS